MYTPIALTILIVIQAASKLAPADPFAHYGTSLYRTIDPGVDELIRNLNRSSGIQPWEVGNLVESDMRLPVPKLRNGLKGNASDFFRWPNATLIYKLDGHFNRTERAFILGAMREFEKYTCVRFKERTDEKSYASIDNSDYGCWADVGRGIGKTLVNLQQGCADALTTPIHELMHALGFFHEHNRLDRDQFIEVVYDHMIPDPSIYFNFQLSEDHDVTNFSIPYDIGSIMHYSKYSFSVQPGKLETMRPKVAWNGTFGQRETLSKYDALLINIMYCGAPVPKEPLPVPDQWIPAEPLVRYDTTTVNPVRSTTLRILQTKPTVAKMTSKERERMQRELINPPKVPRISSPQTCPLFIDINAAYDGVNWKELRNILDEYGFPVLDNDRASATILLTTQQPLPVENGACQTGV
ncbi:hatching enzyme 1.2-like [Sabethes cyaneus]|uniref:hatching enzyme 1.2-like n=1 Tax=Sabethes cyaneus TaxID=53552 RepID=UPI00237E4EFB|nr:hatching enzyme 1.2-like [Sabethes cyaneus]